MIYNLQFLSFDRFSGEEQYLLVEIDHRIY